MTADFRQSSRVFFPPSAHQAINKSQRGNHTYAASVRVTAELRSGRPLVSRICEMISRPVAKKRAVRDFGVEGFIQVSPNVAVQLTPP